MKFHDEIRNIDEQIHELTLNKNKLLLKRYENQIRMLVSQTNFSIHEHDISMKNYLEISHSNEGFINSLNKFIDDEELNHLLNEYKSNLGQINDLMKKQEHCMNKFYRICETFVLLNGKELNKNE